MQSSANPRYAFLFIGLITIIAFTPRIAVFFMQPKDIYWTANTMKESLDQASSRLEIFIREKPIMENLNNENLYIMESGEYSILSKTDFSFRFNNYDKWRASQVEFMMFNSFVLGFAMTILCFGIASFIRQKKTVAN